MTKQQEQAEIDKILNRVAAKNNAVEDREEKPSKFAAGDLAAYLRKWTRGTPIIRIDSGATFWRKSGSQNVTKLTYKEIEALVQYGFGTCIGDPRKAGATFTVKYPLK